MVRIENNKLVIEIEQPMPEEFYAGLLKDIIDCIQALHETHRDEPIPGSICFLLELYKEMLPNQEQAKKMFGKKTI
ncbi:MAG: hypothetical protein ACLQQ4_14480 [Bacteroidia bacterium]